MADQIDGLPPVFWPIAEGVNVPRVHQSLTVLVEHANRTEPEHVRNVDGLLPSPGIELSIAATFGLLVVSGTIRTVHTRLIPMMIGVCLVGSLMAQATIPKVSFQDGAFLVTGALGSEIVPIGSKGSASGPVDSKSGRFKLVVGSKTVIFDSKGLTVSMKGWSTSSSLKAVPTSGKIATKESNAELMGFVKSGERKLDVSAVSGFELRGTDLYLLARWDDKAHRPWLEAVMKIDLASKRPQASLLGRFDAISTATGRVDDILFERGGDLAILGNKGGKFGLAEFSIDGKSTRFTELGPAVGKARLFGGQKTAWALTATPYGTNILSLVDIDRLSCETLGEIRGKMLSINNPGLAKYKAPEGTRMLNLLTGSEIPVETDSDQKQIENGVLVWSPSKKPTEAILLDSSFRRLALWKAPPLTKVVKPVPHDMAKPVTPPAKLSTKPLPKGKTTGKTAQTKQPVKPQAKPKRKNKPEVKLEVSSKPAKKKKA